MAYLIATIALIVLYVLYLVFERWYEENRKYVPTVYGDLMPNPRRKAKGDSE